jgi:hypothetical protein
MLGLGISPGSTRAPSPAGEVPGGNGLLQEDLELLLQEDLSPILLA